MTDIDPKQIMAALEKIISASPADVISAITMPGDPRPMAERVAALPPRLKFAIGSITFGRDGTKVSMVSKSAAIELAARCLGMVQDHTILEDARRPPVTTTGSLEGLTTQEKAERFAAMVNSGPH